jgi:protein SCO1/2
MRIAIGTVAAAAIVIGADIAYRHWADPAGGGVFSSRGIARIGGPFELIDHNGARRRDTDFRGRLMLVFFGYTNCPDVCPTVLQDFGAVLTKLGSAAAAVQAIMITVDPARDTPPRLKFYLENFDRRVIALTGTPDAIARTAKTYKVYFAKSRQKADGHSHDHTQEQGAGAGDYLMDHGSIIYLMGRDGGYLTHFTAATGAGAMAATIAKHL